MNSNEGYEIEKIKCDASFNDLSQLKKCSRCEDWENLTKFNN